MRVGLLNVEMEINAGTERLVATHANALKKRGFDVDVICAYYNNVFTDEFKKINIIEYAPKLKSLKFMHRTRVSLSLINKNVDFLKDYDALIAYRPFTNILAVNAKKKFGTKILWYCSHPEKHLYPKYFKTLKNNFIFKTALLPGLIKDQKSVNYFDKIWVNSHHMWTKINLIYNFNKHKVLYPPAGKILNKSKKGEFIICLSRIEPEKNQLLLLNALTLIKEKIKVVFIGKITNQNYFNYLKRFIKKHRLNVIFTGELSDKEVKKWFDKSFLNVYTSLDEDFGIVPLEALSAGKPTLTHVSNGVSEIIPQRFVFSDLKELAKKIIEIKEGVIKGPSISEERIPIRIKNTHLKELISELR